MGRTRSWREGKDIVLVVDLSFLFDKFHQHGKDNGEIRN